MMLLTLLLAGLGAAGQTITYTSSPANNRLYPRDAQDSSAVTIAGQVSGTGVDSVVAEIFKNGVSWKRVAAKLTYTGSVATFSLSSKIHAELTQHNVTFSTKTGATQTAAASWTNLVSGDVYVLDGQSNTEACYCYAGGYAPPTPSQWVRSFGSASQDGTTVSNNLTWGTAVNNVSGANYSVGVWGYSFAAKIVQNYGIPVCVVNGAVGGTLVNQHLKNTSNPTDLGTIYGRLLFRLQKAELTNGIKALLWYQGESDYGTVPATYSSTFNTVYNSWMADYPSISKVYIVQTHHGCTTGLSYPGDIREIHRTMPATYSKIVTMSSNALPGHDGCHYQTQGYDSLASRLYRLVAKQFYGSTDTLEIGAPNIVKAYFSNAGKTQIKLVFNNTSNLQVTTAGSYNLKDYFYLSDNQSVTSYTTSGNTITLNLAAASTATTITYTPNDFYNGTSATFEGPYLVNTRQIGALSFKAFPVLAANDGTPDEVPQPTFTNSTPGIGTTTTFTATATPTPTTWSWIFSPAVTYTGGTNANSQNPQVIFPGAGTYQITLITTNAVGSSSYSSSITLTAPPVADFNAAGAYTDQLVSFTDNSANVPASWSWTFPAGVTFANGSKSSTANPVVYFPAAGTYDVTLGVTNTAGSSSVTKSVTIAERRPANDFSVATATPTAGAAVDFTNAASSTPTAYAWTVPANCTFTGGTTATSQNIKLIFPRPGSYNITMSAANIYGVQMVKTRTVVVQ